MAFGGTGFDGWGIGLADSTGLAGAPLGATFPPPQSPQGAGAQGFMKRASGQLEEKALYWR